VFDYYLDRIDWPVAVRGAGNGFGVLVIAALLWAGFSKLGYPWAPAAVWVGFPVGFVIAAWKSGKAPSPPLTGAVAAFFAYTLTIPLLLMSGQPLDWNVVVGTLIAGVLVGTATGWVMERRARHQKET
jgi:hypothetical protein